MEKRRKFKKIDYSSKKYNNPFFNKHKGSVKPAKESKWKIVSVIVLTIILSGTLAWFALFHHYFKITVIHAKGPEKISKEEVENIAWKQTGEKRYLLGNQNNIFLFNEENLIKNIESDFNVSKLKIEKELPNKIIITYAEKNYSLVWIEGGKYFLYSDEDKSVKEVDPLQIKQDLPLIENTSDWQVYDNRLDGQDEKISCSKYLYNKLKEANKYELDRFIIGSKEDGSINAIIKGPRLIFSCKDDLDKQLTKLSILINEKLKGSFSAKQYIDLRFSDKVYYQ